MMKRLPLSRLISTLLLAVFVLGMTPARAAAEDRLIVRAGGLLGGLPVVKSACRILGCNVLYALDGTLNNLILVAVPDVLDTRAARQAALDGSRHRRCRSRSDGIHRGHERQRRRPPALLDKTPVDYYGTTVRRGYVHQPAFEILGLAEAHDRYGLTGRGVTVAVIDTGVDTNHPVLEARRCFRATTSRATARAAPSRATSISRRWPSSIRTALASSISPRWRSSISRRWRFSTATRSIRPSVTARSSPASSTWRRRARRFCRIKAFGADGSGYLSDVLRALYFASNKNAKVINMSFSFTTKSRELERTLDYVTSKGAIAVSSAGNDGRKTNVYPASYSTVMGVASTTDWDTLSNFSNFGTSVAWIAAPGEAIVSTYPFNTYAAAWGTSFSTPFAAGTAALLAENAAADHESAGGRRGRQLACGSRGTSARAVCTRRRRFARGARVWAGRPARLW